MSEFTKKQGQYLAFIHQYIMLNRVAPAEADMQAYFRKTPSSVHQMIVKLAEKGLIRKTPHTPRSIQLLVPYAQIPELGAAVSGKVNSPGGNWSQASYLKAYRFAAEAHKGQSCPGTDLPYLMHVSFVSMEIMACLGVEKHPGGDLAIQCALLHDVIEDTGIRYVQVEKAFDSQVAQGVLALTKNASLPKAQAMQDSLERIRQQPYEVWLVKLADRITNLAPPPHYWKRDKIVRYREEALEIHFTLHEASDYLGQRLIHKIDAYKMYL